MTAGVASQQSSAISSRFVVCSQQSLLLLLLTAVLYGGGSGHVCLCWCCPRERCTPCVFWFCVPALAASTVGYLRPAVATACALKTWALGCKAWAELRTGVFHFNHPSCCLRTAHSHVNSWCLVYSRVPAIPLLTACLETPHHVAAHLSQCRSAPGAAVPSQCMQHTPA